MIIKKPLFTLLLSLFVLLSATSAMSLSQPSSLPLKTSVEPFAVAADAIRPGSPGGVLLALTLHMDNEWYSYSNVPGETGKPTSLTALAADGSPLEVFYPEGKKKPDSYDPTITVAAYLDGTKLFILVPDALTAPFPASLSLDLLLCHPTKCVPARINLSFGEAEIGSNPLPPADGQSWWNEFLHISGGRIQAQTPAAEENADANIVDWHFSPAYFQPGLEVGGLLSAVLMGLLAGLILNVMPCVLPVVSLKLSSLLGAGAEEGADRIRAFREHNVFFVLGVISFFLFLAVVLGATGSAWGALFQNRWLVLGMAAIMGALSLSLFGLFHLPVIDLKFGVGNKDPRKQAFFTGMLTTLLATPCSGPFLGGVLGWALIQGPVVIATVFVSIGLGMSAPYILLILNPGLSRFLPKSGPWIEYVEKGIAFFLLGTAFYLVGIALGDASLRILAPLWVVLFGGWLWFRTKSVGQGIQLLLRTSIFVLLAATVYWTTPMQTEADPWEQFNPAVLNQDLGEERIFLEFTADWCPTCKALEATVMTRENVEDWKRRYNIRFIKVDMTERDPEAEALLAALGSRSLPTAAVFRKNDRQTPVVIRDLYTVNQLENLLKSL